MRREREEERKKKRKGKVAPKDEINLMRYAACVHRKLSPFVAFANIFIISL